MAAKKAAKKKSARKKATRKVPKKPRPPQDTSRSGRPKGASNKAPKSVIEAILEACDQAGDIKVQAMLADAEKEGRDLSPFEEHLAKQKGRVAYLMQIALGNEKTFAMLLGKTIPRNVNLSVESDTLRVLEEVAAQNRKAAQEVSGMRLPNNIKPPIEVPAKVIQ